jgi:hypothetical protein
VLGWARGEPGLESGSLGLVSVHTLSPGFPWHLRARVLERGSGPYSPKCPEGAFCEVRIAPVELL